MLFSVLKSKDFSALKNIMKAAKGTSTEKRTLNFLVKTQALMSVRTLTNIFMFRKGGVLTKTLKLLRKGWSYRCKNFHACPQDNFVKLEFERKLILQDHFFQNTKKHFRVLFPSMKSKSQQTETKTVWRHLAKYFWKSSLQYFLTGVIFKIRSF